MTSTPGRLPFTDSSQAAKPCRVVAPCLYTSSRDFTCARAGGAAAIAATPTKQQRNANEKALLMGVSSGSRVSAFVYTSGGLVGVGWLAGTLQRRRQSSRSSTRVNVVHRRRRTQRSAKLPRARSRPREAQERV